MIAINCRFLVQDLTGVQRFAEEITSELARTRDDVRLFAPHGELRHETLGGRRIEQIGNASGHLWEQWDLPRSLRREFGSPLLLSLMNTGPVLYPNQIVTHHDVTYLRFPGTYTRRFRIAYRILSSTTLRRARRIITVSEFSRREIAELYRLDPGKIVVVPNAAGRGFRRARLDSAEPYLLAVASFLPHKNIDRMIHAFEAYRRETGSRTKLVLVGGFRPAAMAGVAGSAPSGGGVQVVGRVDDQTLQRLYAGARAFIFPSLYEGFGVPPLEAQAAGTAVAASDIPPLREVLRDSAWFFDPRDVQSILEAIRVLDTDAETRRNLSLAGLENAGNYGWTTSAQSVSALLDEVSR